MLILLGGETSQRRRAGPRAPSTLEASRREPVAVHGARASSLSRGWEATRSAGVGEVPAGGFPRRRTARLSRRLPAEPSPWPRLSFPVWKADAPSKGWRLARRAASGGLKGRGGGEGGPGVPAAPGAPGLPPPPRAAPEPQREPEPAGGAAPEPAPTAGGAAAAGAASGGERSRHGRVPGESEHQDQQPRAGRRRLGLGAAPRPGLRALQPRGAHAAAAGEGARGRGAGGGSRPGRWDQRLRGCAPPSLRKDPQPRLSRARRAAATPGRLRHGRPPPRSPGNPFSSRRPSCRPCEHTPGALTFGAPPLQRPLIPARWSPAATITARDSLSVSVGLSLFARTLSPALQGTKPPAPSGSAWLHPRTLSV